MELYGRKIAMFRCHIDPGFGGIPKNAFTMGQGMGQTPGIAILTPIGIYVRLDIQELVKKNLHEHLVPFANLQSIRFDALEVKESETVPQAGDQDPKPKGKPGRPFGFSPKKAQEEATNG